LGAGPSSPDTNLPASLAGWELARPGEGKATAKRPIQAREGNAIWHAQETKLSQSDYTQSLMPCKNHPEKIFQDKGVEMLNKHYYNMAKESSWAVN
jgi:hypothetical protein